MNIRKNSGYCWHRARITIRGSFPGDAKIQRNELRTRQSDLTIKTYKSQL